MVEPKFFKSPADFRDWLAERHETETELLVGFHKRGSGIDSLTWPEAVDEALCAGWIDGVRKSIDAERYSIRFTKRRPTSIWSSVNVARIQVLTAEGRMHPAGLRAFAGRKEARTGIYSHEQTEFPELLPDDARAFQAHAEAWAYFESCPASYRKAAIWGILSAKRDETKRKRLAELIDDSAHGRKIARLSRH